MKLFEYNNGLLLSSKAAKYQNFVFIKIHSHDREHFITVKQLQLAHYWLALRARQLFIQMVDDSFARVELLATYGRERMLNIQISLRAPQVKLIALNT